MLNNGSDFEWHSKNKQPDHSKLDQILNSYVLVLFLNFRDHSYSCSYGHQSFKYQTIQNLSIKTFGLQMNSEFDYSVFEPPLYVEHFLI